MPPTQIPNEETTAALQSARRRHLNMVTIDDLIDIYGPRIRELPSNKPRDPVERELLQRMGDPAIERETGGLTRNAGERRRPPKAAPDLP